MLYNLRNGGTIRIKTEKYFDMSDEDLEKLELYYRGAEINDPFYSSVLEGKPSRDKDVEDDVELDTLEVPITEEIEEPEEED